MTREEFNEIKGISLKMKASGKIKVLEENPISREGPLEGVTIAGSSSQIPTIPYAIVAKV